MNNNKIQLKSIAINHLIVSDLFTLQELDIWLQQLLTLDTIEGNEIEYYFHNKVLDDYEKNFNVTYVVIDENDIFNFQDKKDIKLYGAYTLSFSNINISQLSKSQRRKTLGGMSFPGILSKEDDKFLVNYIPSLLLGRVAKNSIENYDGFLNFVFEDISNTMKSINNYASCKFLSIDCVPELYDKIYSQYGFTIVSKNKNYYNCVINLERNKKISMI